MLKFVFEPIYLRFESIWLLLLDQLGVTQLDLLDFGQAAVGETIAGQADFNQVHVLVQCFEKFSLDLLAEKVVSESYPIDESIVGECVDKKDEALVV